MKRSTQDTAALAAGYKNTSLIQGADHKGVQGAQGPCRHQCVAGRAPPREREKEREGERERERSRREEGMNAQRNVWPPAATAAHEPAMQMLKKSPAWLSPLSVAGLPLVGAWDAEIRLGPLRGKLTANSNHGKYNGNYYNIRVI